MVKTHKNLEGFEEETQDQQGGGRDSPCPEMERENSPICGQGTLYRWLARPLSGAKSASTSTPCSAAEPGFFPQALFFFIFKTLTQKLSIKTIKTYKSILENLYFTLLEGSDIREISNSNGDSAGR